MCCISDISNLDLARDACSLIIILSDDPHSQREVEQFLNEVLNEKLSIKIKPQHITLVCSTAKNTIQERNSDKLKHLYHIKRPKHDQGHVYKEFMCSLKRRVPLPSRQNDKVDVEENLL